MHNPWLASIFDQDYFSFFKFPYTSLTNDSLIVFYVCVEGGEDWLMQKYLTSFVDASVMQQCMLSPSQSAFSSIFSQKSANSEFTQSPLQGLPMVIGFGFGCGVTAVTADQLWVSWGVGCTVTCCGCVGWGEAGAAVIVVWGFFAAIGVPLGVFWFAV